MAAQFLKWAACDPALDAATPEARAIWKQAQTAASEAWGRSATPYRTTLRTAGISGLYGVRENADGVLIVPMHDCMGELWAVQLLPATFHPRKSGAVPRPSVSDGARLFGLHHWIGKVPFSGTAPKAIGITEYLQDAIDWHAAENIPVMVAFSAENLAVLAGMVRTAFASASVGIWARWPAQEHAARLAATQTGAHAVVQDVAPKPGEFWLWP